MNAADLLQQGADTIRQRAQFRDTPGGEYAMPLAVRLMQAYNGGRLESDVDGNVFMVFLKLARHQNGGTLNMDDFVDGAAYMAMAGEAAGNQPKEAPVAIPKSGVGVAYSSGADAQAIADHRMKIEQANASYRR